MMYSSSEQASPGTPAPQGELASPEGSRVAFAAGERLTLAVAVTAQDGRILRYLLDVRRQPPFGVVQPARSHLRGQSQS